MSLRVPKGTGPAGRRLLAAVNEHDGREQWIRDGHENEILRGCLVAADRLHEIATVLETLDTVDPAWTRLAAVERQIRSSLRVDLEKLGLPFGPPAAVKRRLTPSDAGTRAAAARWGHGALG